MRAQIALSFFIKLFFFFFLDTPSRERESSRRTVIFRKLPHPPTRPPAPPTPPLLVTGRIFDYAKQIGKSYLRNRIWDYLFSPVHSRSKL